jgi:hypothetical protein
MGSAGLPSFVTVMRHLLIALGFLVGSIAVMGQETPPRLLLSTTSDLK